MGECGILVIEVLEGEELTGKIDGTSLGSIDEGIWEGIVVEGLLEGSIEGPWDGADVIGTSEGLTLGEIEGIEVGDDDVGSDVGMVNEGALVRGIFEGIIDGRIDDIE